MKTQLLTQLLKFAARLLPVAVLLAGCASAPPGPQFEIRQGERIGLLVEVDDTPVHTHYGPDGSGRFVRGYPYPWQLDASVTELLRRQLTAAGFSTVDLGAQGMRYANLDRLIVQSGRQWVAAADGMAERLRRQGIRAVVLVKSAPTPAAHDCADGPCRAHDADGPGLYSRTNADITTYYAVAAFSWHVYLLDPPADLATAEPLRTTLQTPSVALLGLPPPADLKALSAAELEPVRDKVLEYTEAEAEDVVRALGGPRVLEKQAKLIYRRETKGLPAR
jgi:hypothetical protein